MRRIAGLWRQDGRPVGRADAERMLQPLRHSALRAWTWSDGALAMGQLSSQAGPASSDEDRVLAADVRLDDRERLAAILGVARPAADEALVLAAYRRWDDACVDRLLGDFAFALWDARRRALVCARDALGVKPLYYHPGRGWFAFASEIKALLALADLPRDLDDGRAADYLLGDPDDAEATFYQAIRRLPPAHVFVVEAGQTRRRRYWSLDASRELRLPADADYEAAFRDAFTAAVRDRLPDREPAGSLLSGGLDSSAIVGVARSLRRAAGVEDLHTFSAIFDDVPESNERDWIDAVVAFGPVRPHYVRGDRLAPLEDLGEMLLEEDEPFWAPHLFLHRALYRAARAAGVGCLLDGFDGDTVVSHGLGRLAELGRSLRWITLAREVRGVSRRLRRPARTVFLGQVVRPLMPRWVRRIRWAVRGVGFAPGATPELIGPGLRRRTDLAARLDRLRCAAVRVPRDAREAHVARLRLGLIPLGFEVADRAAAPCAVEPRYPFFDRRLVELCVSLPASQKLRDGWTRSIMRRALAPWYPPALRGRGDKGNLGPVFLRAMRGLDARWLADLAREPAVSDCVDMEALQRLQRRLAARPTLTDAFTIWRGLTVAVWLTRDMRSSTGGG